MSDINIPGVSSRFNTNKIVEDLMKVEKAPLTKMESRAEKLESDKTIWQNLRTRITDLTNQCASLYNYDNPFGERVVSSSNNAVTATAIRNADLTEHTVKVIQTASADKLISSPLSADTKIPAGHYVFKIGEKDVSYFFNGGTPKVFVDGLNRRAQNLLSAQIIQAKPGEQVMLLESKMTGAANTIRFEGDAKELADQIGWIQSKTSSSANENRETVPVAAFEQSNPYNISKTTDECLINPQENISVPLNSEGDKTLSFTLKVIDLAASESYRKTQEPFRPGIIGSASFKDVTLTNDVSLFPQQPPQSSPTSLSKETPSEAIRIYIEGARGKRQIPLTEPVGSPQVISMSSAESDGIFRSIRVENNSHRYAVILSEASLTENNSQAPQTEKRNNAIESARDAIFEYDGIKLTRPVNKIDDVNDQITFTLNAPTAEPVSLKVETDAETVKDKVIEFAYHYNKLIEDINVYTTKDEKVINELSYLDDAEKEAKKEILGTLQGDITLIQMKNRLQQIINNSYDIQSPNQISMLFQLGIGSNLSAYSGYSASKMRGYLEIDENKLNDSVQNHIEDLEKIFGYDTNNDYITDNGIAYLLNQYLASFSKQGGIIDGKLQTFDQQITQQEKSITNFNERMEKKEADYKRQFGNMEAMYERLKDSSRALDSLNSGNNGNK
ncbi:MAG: flagellar filament capping protein FliD [Spirochaetia bacterium]|nr:flagellar filament capping protein FliD [Spirochaetia bacterium]